MLHRKPNILLVLFLITVYAGFSQPVATPVDPDLDALFNVKVTTASKFSELLADAPGVMSVVSRDELNRFGGVTLREVLERVPGLTGSSGYFTDRSLIAVRGDQTRVNGGHVLILINGRPVREILEGGIGSDILESFPLSVLERIEVIKGPGSVLYGSDAFSGVINLITLKAAGNSFHLGAAGGAAGATDATGTVSYQLGELSVVAGGQYRKRPQWGIGFNGLTFANLPTKQDVVTRDAGTGAYLGVNYKNLSFNTSYTALEMPTFVGGEVGDARWKRGFADLGYSLHPTSKWAMTLNLTYTRSTIDAPDDPYIHRDSNQMVLEWTNFVTFSEKDRLTFGTLYSHNEGTETYFGVTPSVVISQGERSGTGFYVQHEHRLTDDLKLIGGLQANKIGDLAVDVVPRAGVLWNPAAHWTVKALFGKAFRAPSLNETGLHHPVLQGNPNLTPEKVGTLDLALSYQSNRAQASLGYFHSRETDRIEQDLSIIPGRFLNRGLSTFQGLETEGKYYFHHDWFLIGSLLYQTSQDATVELNLTPLPSLSAKAGISYRAENGTLLSLFDVYQGHIPGYSTSLNPRPVAFHSLNAHARFDLSKRWLKDNALGYAIFLHANNLTNHQVWLPAWGSNQDTIPVHQGRVLYFGIEVWHKRS